MNDPISQESLTKQMPGNSDCWCCSALQPRFGIPRMETCQMLSYFTALQGGAGRWNNKTKLLAVSKGPWPWGRLHGFLGWKQHILVSNIIKPEKRKDKQHEWTDIWSLHHASIFEFSEYIDSKTHLEKQHHRITARFSQIPTSIGPLWRNHHKQSSRSYDRFYGKHGKCHWWLPTLHPRFAFFYKL